MNANSLVSASMQTTALWIWLCVIAAIGVFAMILYSIATFRPSIETASRPSWRELVWSVVPIAIVIAAAVPALKHGGARASSDAAVLARHDQHLEHCVTATAVPTVGSQHRLSSTCPVP